MDPLTALQDAPILAALIERLQLSPPGAGGWLEKLGAGAGGRQTERMLLLNPTGETVLKVDGQEWQVTIPDDLKARLDSPGAGLVMVHNHPAGTGLSRDDLMQLLRRGVSAIAAIGQDGSVYIAAAGPRHGGSRFPHNQYRLACTEVHRRLLFYFKGSSPQTWPPFFAHLVAQALAQASIIEYRAFFAPAVQAEYGRVANYASLAVAAAARLLAGADGQDPPQESGTDRICVPKSSALSQVFANVQSRVTV
jgi:hypothetical protein